MNDIPTGSTAHLEEALDLIGYTTLSGVFYGIALVLYCFCARLWYLQFRRDPQRRRRTVFFLFIASIIMMDATVVVALGTQIARLAYIDHRDFPGGPLNYEASIILMSSNPLGNGYDILTIVVDLLTQGIQVWRLWNVWSGVRFNAIIITLVLVLWVVYLGLAVASERLPVHSESLACVNIAVLSLDSCFTILITTLITLRLILVRRRHLKTMGTSASEFAGQYLSIAAILIESYALESVWMVTALILFVMNDPSFAMLNSSSTQVKVIAYLLVTFRVSSGRAWDSQTVHRLSSLRWDGGGQSSCMETTASRVTQAAEISVTLPVESTLHSRNSNV